jgi:AmmeMemoRadiSam system protein A
MSSLDAPPAANAAARANGSGSPTVDAEFVRRHGATLLALARRSILDFARERWKDTIDLARFPAELAAPRATFVTLSKGGELRGCVGSAKAWRPLVKDVAENAIAAAMEDPRFAPLGADEVAEIRISISLLSEPVRVDAANEAELLARIEPGTDGLILHAGALSALFLPQVWRQLREPREFLAQLRAKAGLPRTGPTDGIEWYRFRATSVAEPGAMH